MAFYVHEHNHVLAHSAFRGEMPDEMYFGTEEALPRELRSRAAAARLGGHPKPAINRHLKTGN
jgi:hypothetical protein